MFGLVERAAVWFLDVQPPAPDAKNAPGYAALNNLVSGVEAIVLLICIGAIAWAGAELALGNKGHNAQMVQQGKSRIIYAFGGAILVGAAGFLVNYFLHIGGGFV